MRAHYLLDTNAWSNLIRHRSGALSKRFADLTQEQIYLSPVVLGELLLGYYKGDRTSKRKAVIDLIVSISQPLKITPAVADNYAQLRTELEQQGIPIGRNDAWIAAEALHHGLVLVTDNTQEFERVKGLKVENWI
jgi:tRNA(fMet)-specific endonuclease VapC